jgi:N4-(beta-N-acetylglucosaminyl)-L-asparaginase
MDATSAAEDAMRRIMAHAPQFQGALVVMDAQGGHGAAAFGWVFHYTVISQHSKGDAEVHEVPPMSRGVVNNVGHKLLRREDPNRDARDSVRSASHADGAL